MTRFAARLSDSEARWTTNVRERDDERNRHLGIEWCWMVIIWCLVTGFLAGYK